VSFDQGYKLIEISDWSKSQSDKEVVLFTVSGNSMKTSSGCNYKVLYKILISLVYTLFIVIFPSSNGNISWKTDQQKLLNKHERYVGLIQKFFLPLNTIFLKMSVLCPYESYFRSL